MSFHNRLYFLFITLILVSCASSKTENINGSYFNEKFLIGTWSSNEVTPNGFYLSVVTYTADGMKCTLGTSYDKKNGYDRGLYISKWKLYKNRLDVTIVKTSTPLLVVGETLSDQVVYLTKSEFKTRLFPTEPAFENASIETYTKLSNIPDLSVCETANKL